MANCCNNSLNKVFCNVFNKYYNTLYVNGEISKKETDNLLIISYIRKLLLNPSYEDYTKILLKALRCIADRSCLLDSSWLYNRSTVPTVTNKYISTSSREASAETDPIFRASAAYNITNDDIARWNTPQDSDIFIVNVDRDGSLYADASFTEIYQAWQNGKDILVNYSDAIYQLQYIDSGGAWFFRCERFNNIPTVDFLAVSNDLNVDTWTRDIIRIGEAVETENVSGNIVTKTIEPNKLYHFTGNAITELNISLGTLVPNIANIYSFYFIAGSANPTISLPNTVTIDGTPSIASGDYVEFNIMNSVAFFKVVTI